MKQILFLSFVMCLSSFLYAGHEHAQKGDNGGYIVEINDNFKLEFIHDETNKKVTIMLFDKNGKAVKTDKAPRLNISRLLGRKQVKLTAIKADGKGLSSVFSGESKYFKKGMHAKISVYLDEKYYTLELPHKPH